MSTDNRRQWWTLTWSLVYTSPNCQTAREYARPHQVFNEGLASPPWCFPIQRRACRFPSEGPPTATRKGQTANLEKAAKWDAMQLDHFPWKWCSHLSCLPRTLRKCSIFVDILFRTLRNCQHTCGYLNTYIYIYIRYFFTCLVSI